MRNTNAYSYISIVILKQLIMNSKENLTPEERKSLNTYQKTFDKTFLKKLTELSNNKNEK